MSFLCRLGLHRWSALPKLIPCESPRICRTCQRIHTAADGHEWIEDESSVSCEKCDTYIVKHSRICPQCGNHSPDMAGCMGCSGAGTQFFFFLGGPEVHLYLKPWQWVYWTAGVSTLYGLFDGRGLSPEREMFVDAFAARPPTSFILNVQEWLDGRELSIHETRAMAVLRNLARTAVFFRLDDIRRRDKDEMLTYQELAEMMEPGERRRPIYPPFKEMNVRIRTTSLRGSPPYLRL